MRYCFSINSSGLRTSTLECLCCDKRALGFVGAVSDLQVRMPATILPRYRQILRGYRHTGGTCGAAPCKRRANTLLMMPARRSPRQQQAGTRRAEYGTEPMILLNRWVGAVVDST